MLTHDLVHRPIHADGVVIGNGTGLMTGSYTNELEPKFKVTANILDKKRTNEVIDGTLTFLSDVLSNSLGPYGSTTIIQDRFLNHTITKDGYSILKKIYIEEEESRTIVDLVKKISRNLVRKVGDGSTSSIIVANALYKELNKDETLKKISPKDLLDVLNVIARHITEEVEAMATPISDDFKELEAIATVSTNNDKEMGKLICEIFQKVGRYGFIHTEKSKLPTTYYDNAKGFEINRGVINSLMLRKEDKKVVEFENPLVFMTDGILNEEDIPFLTEVIGHFCLKLSQPVVFIAKGYSHQVQTFFHTNLLQNRELPVAAIDISTESTKAQERFKDLAINLGAVPHLRTQNEPLDYEAFHIDRLGECSKFLATENYTRFIEGQGNETEIQDRIESIKQRMLEMNAGESYIEYDDEIYELRRRLACLQNSMAVLYVGGATEDEKETVKYLVEDAVFACKSALEKGYILGGNLAIPIIIHHNKKELVEKVYNELKDKFYFTNTQEVAENLTDTLFRAFKRSFGCVLHNCFLDEERVEECIAKCLNDKSIYNLKNYKYESMKDTTIINSCETDIEILNSAISIIGLLITSNQFVKINAVK